MRRKWLRIAQGMGSGPTRGATANGCWRPRATSSSSRSPARRSRRSSRAGVGIGTLYRRFRHRRALMRAVVHDVLGRVAEEARQLGISSTTVSAAYEKLWSEGLVSARVGAGTFVSRDAPGGRPDPGGGRARGLLRARPAWHRFSLPTAFDRAADFDFRSGLPDASLFPFAAWRRLLAQHPRAGAVGAGVYADPAGHPALREAIARHVGVARGIAASPEDVVVTNGTQQALDLVARVLLGGDDGVAVEDPGYEPPRRLFQSLGLRVVGVPIDREGLVVERLPADARLVYVTPSQQYPLGMSMSPARRPALLDWGRWHRAAVVEDDYDSEFRFGGRPVEPLRSLDRDGLVVYVGSFSKTHLPTLRLGFVLAPQPLGVPLQKAKYVADWHAPTPIQAALASFIEEGGFGRHLRRMRAVYRARHGLVTGILARDFAPHLELVPSVAGLHVSALARGVRIRSCAGGRAEVRCPRPKCRPRPGCRPTPSGRRAGGCGGGCWRCAGADRWVRDDLLGRACTPVARPGTRRQDGTVDRGRGALDAAEPGPGPQRR